MKRGGESKSAPKGISMYHIAVLKKISRSFRSPTTFYLHVRQHSLMFHVFFFSKTIILKKMTVFMKFVVSVTVINDNPSLNKWLAVKIH